MSSTVEERDVGEDPDLQPEEKQVSLVATKKASSFIVHSDVASITRWLLRHPAFEPKRIRERDGQVVSCTGTFPVGGVDLKGKPRMTDQFGRMLSSAALREAGGDD